MKSYAAKTLAVSIALLVFLSTVAGCGARDGLDPKNPVTLTMWHNYGGAMKETMMALIDEFNATVGKERGIIVNVTSIASSRELNERLTLVARDVPGASEMPDIVTAYPSMARTLQEAGLIADLDPHFSKSELDAYIPAFLEEGRLEDGKLYVFPVAKSTEALFVNKTFFDRFAEATGVRLEDLATFEGIAEASAKYCEWTDAQTPAIPADGKQFFAADSWFNVALVGSSQLGSSFVEDGSLNMNSETYKRIWDLSVYPALTGAYAPIDGYSSDYYKTGEIVACIGSTAGILFYGESVIYPDNSSEAIESIVLPYPVFAGGEKIALQRGAGMVVARSDAKKEAAAAVFLKWFASPAQNMRFVSGTGYLPVTREAFGSRMAEEIDSVENPTVRMMLQVATKTYGEYSFIVAPNVPGYDAMVKDYETKMKAAMDEGRRQVIGGGEAGTLSDSLLEEFLQ